MSDKVNLWYLNMSSSWILFDLAITIVVTFTLKGVCCLPFLSFVVVVVFLFKIPCQKLCSFNAWFIVNIILILSLWAGTFIVCTQRTSMWNMNLGSIMWWILCKFQTQYNMQKDALKQHSIHLNAISQRCRSNCVGFF